MDENKNLLEENFTTEEKTDTVEEVSPIEDILTKTDAAYIPYLEQPTAEPTVLAAPHTTETMPSDTTVLINNKIPVRRKRKSSSFGMKAAAIALALVLGGGSFGLGLGIGGGISNKYIKEPAAEQVQASQPREAFSFANSQSQSSIVPLVATLNSAALSVPDIVETVSDAVVSINVTGEATTFFNQIYEAKGAGSGIIFMEDSEKVYIATNNHVIQGAKAVTISVDDQIQISANLVGTNVEADIAVISVSKKDMKDAGVTYKIAKLGDSSKLRVGEPVIAIGNALGEGKTATMGIISAKNKQITVDRNKVLDAIQTDAAINSGNSGGPLVNMNGEVVGINTAKLSGSGVEGMGYSIPISEAQNIIQDLLNADPADLKPYLGIEGFSFTEEYRQMYNVPVIGVYVKTVFRNGTAYSMGIRDGDLIVGFNGAEIKTWEDLVSAITSSAVGDTLKIDIYRNGVTPMSFEGKMMTDPSLTNF